MNPTNHKAGGLLVNHQRPVLCSVRDIMPVTFKSWGRQDHIADCMPLEDQGAYNACGAYSTGASLQSARWLVDG